MEVYIMGVHQKTMRDVSIKEARENFKAIIDRVMAGERVNILRRSKVVAQLIPPEPDPIQQAPSMEAFRKTIKIKGKSMSQEVIKARREERD
jgi:antitoxin (DNA-binding transcriptional repressor) of toxin-antitoxin stability system